MLRVTCRHAVRLHGVVGTRLILLTRLLLLTRLILLTRDWIKCTSHATHASLRHWLVVHPASTPGWARVCCVGTSHVTHASLRRWLVVHPASTPGWTHVCCVGTSHVTHASLRRWLVVRPASAPGWARVVLWCCGGVHCFTMSAWWLSPASQWSGRGDSVMTGFQFSVSGCGDTCQNDRYFESRFRLLFIAGLTVLIVGMGF